MSTQECRTQTSSRAEAKEERVENKATWCVCVSEAQSRGGKGGGGYRSDRIYRFSESSRVLLVILGKLRRPRGEDDSGAQDRGRANFSAPPDNSSVKFTQTISKLHFRYWYIVGAFNCVYFVFNEDVTHLRFKFNGSTPGCHVRLP